MPLKAMFTPSNPNLKFAFLSYAQIFFPSMQKLKHFIIKFQIASKPAYTTTAIKQNLILFLFLLWQVAAEVSPFEGK